MRQAAQMLPIADEKVPLWAFSGNPHSPSLEYHDLFFRKARDCSLSLISAGQALQWSSLCLLNVFAQCARVSTIHIGV